MCVAGTRATLAATNAHRDRTTWNAPVPKRSRSRAAGPAGGDGRASRPADPAGGPRAARRLQQGRRWCARGGGILADRQVKIINWY